jgi:cell division protein FtsB
MKFFQREKRLAEQARELKRLRAEVASLRAQNDSMRSGMRRCISCEYRLEAKGRGSA